MKKILTFMFTLVLAFSACFGLTACGKTLKGFDIDFAKKVGEELGITVTFKEIDWDLKETELNSKAIDCIWNGFTYTTDRDNGYFDKERNQQIGGLDFSAFYMENKQVAVVKKADLANFKSNADFLNKNGCSEASSAGETVIKEILKTSNAQLTRQLDVFTAVKAGNYAFGVVDNSMASEYIVSEKGAYHDTLAVVDIESVEKEYYAIGFREGSNLRDVFNYVIKGLYEDGSASAIAKEYALDGALFNGFKDLDTASYTLPTDGDFKYVKDKGSIVIGYTIFAPMAFEG